MPKGFPESVSKSITRKHQCKQGVLEVCPGCEILVSYLGFDFDNPTLGLETALGQYEQGSDIVYQVAKIELIVMAETARADASDT